MKPSEKFKELRGDISRPKFGTKFGVPVHTVKYIEEGIQSIPDELALALEKYYHIPFKWWKTGQGIDSYDKIQEQYPNINIDYLISGEGKLFITENQTRQYMIDEAMKAAEQKIKELLGKKE